MTPRAITIVRRIGAIERKALYTGMTMAKERAIARLWRRFSAATAGY